MADKEQQPWFVGTVAGGLKGVPLQMGPDHQQRPQGPLCLMFRALFSGQSRLITV